MNVVILSVVTYAPCGSPGVQSATESLARALTRQTRKEMCRLFFLQEIQSCDVYLACLPIPPPRRSSRRSIDSSTALSMDRAAKWPLWLARRRLYGSAIEFNVSRHANRALCFPAIMGCHSFDIGGFPFDQAMRKPRHVEITSDCLVLTAHR